mgnify:CR=1 FL=1
MICIVRTLEDSIITHVLLFDQNTILATYYSANVNDRRTIYHNQSNVLRLLGMDWNTLMSEYDIEIKIGT